MKAYRWGSSIHALISCKDHQVSASICPQENIIQVVVATKNSRSVYALHVFNPVYRLSLNSHLKFIETRDIVALVCFDPLSNEVHFFDISALFDRDIGLHTNLISHIYPIASRALQASAPSQNEAAYNSFPPSSNDNSVPKRQMRVLLGANNCFLIILYDPNKQSISTHSLQLLHSDISQSYSLISLNAFETNDLSPFATVLAVCKTSIVNWTVFLPFPLDLSVFYEEELTLRCRHEDNSNTSDSDRMGFSRLCLIFYDEHDIKSVQILKSSFAEEMMNGSDIRADSAIIGSGDEYYLLISRNESDDQSIYSSVNSILVGLDKILISDCKTAVYGIVSISSVVDDGAVDNNGIQEQMTVISRSLSRLLASLYFSVSHFLTHFLHYRHSLDYDNGIQILSYCSLPSSHVLVVLVSSSHLPRSSSAISFHACRFYMFLYDIRSDLIKRCILVPFDRSSAIAESFSSPPYFSPCQTIPRCDSDNDKVMVFLHGTDVIIEFSDQVHNDHPDTGMADKSAVSMLASDLLGNSNLALFQHIVDCRNKGAEYVMNALRADLSSFSSLLDNLSRASDGYCCNNKDNDSDNADVVPFASFSCKKIFSALVLLRIMQCTNHYPSHSEPELFNHARIMPNDKTKLHYDILLSLCVQLSECVESCRSVGKMYNGEGKEDLVIELGTLLVAFIHIAVIRCHFVTPTETIIIALDCCKAMTDQSSATNKGKCGMSARQSLMGTVFHALSSWGTVAESENNIGFDPSLHKVILFFGSFYRIKSYLPHNSAVRDQYICAALEDMFAVTSTANNDRSFNEISRRGYDFVYYYKILELILNEDENYVNNNERFIAVVKDKIEDALSSKSKSLPIYLVVLDAKSVKPVLINQLVQLGFYENRAEAEKDVKEVVKGWIGRLKMSAHQLIKIKKITHS